MDSSAFIIKVTYGGVLRRFRVPVKANGLLDLHIAGLREKISALFTLPVDAEFSLTYTDEDGDVVAFVDDNDLFDITNQRLKFLKICVQLNTGSSANAGMLNSQNLVSKIQKSINDFLKAVPNPRDTISKAYMDFQSSSGPLVSEFLDCISKLGKLSNPLKISPACSPVTKTFCGEASKPGSIGPSLSWESWMELSKRTLAGTPTRFGDSKTCVRVGASFNECPFSGSTVKENSQNPINLNKTYTRLVRTQLPESWCKHDRACHSKKSSNGDYWSSLGVFHKGIYCNGCGVAPISGPRFMSKVKEDYDLCTSCFSVMGNEGDFTRLNMPVYHYMHPFRGQLTQVDPSLKNSVVNEFHGLHLNASPDENDHLREFRGNNATHESVQPGSSSVVEGEVDESQIPENDNMVVGETHPTIPHTRTPSSLSTMDIPVLVQEDREKNDVEETLLKELEGMGFMEIDLNKEILRENDYNLEESIDALCGVSEWDPILEDLQDMGFCDDARNKRLLKKNNGSIEGVLMDLYRGRETED